MPSLHPGDIEIIRPIFQAIVAEPWFNANAVTERELLKLVYRICREFPEDPEQRQALCRAEARARFSRS
jgi:hypothetical protein